MIELKGLKSGKKADARSNKRDGKKMKEGVYYALDQNKDYENKWERKHSGGVA